MDERTSVTEMSDREIVEETLVLLRQFADTIAGFQSSPMSKMLAPMILKLGNK